MSGQPFFSYSKANAPNCGIGIARLDSTIFDFATNTFVSPGNAGQPTTPAAAVGATDWPSALYTAVTPIVYPPAQFPDDEYIFAFIDPAASPTLVGITSGVSVNGSFNFAAPATAAQIVQTQNLIGSIPSVTVIDAELSAAHGTGTWGGGGSSGPVGGVIVNHNFGGVDALMLLNSIGDGVNGANITAFLTTDYVNFRTADRYVQGRAVTGPDGRWTSPIYLLPGAYTLVFSQPSIEATTTTITVA